MPSYRPVRSPLLSTGPSLDEKRRSTRSLRLVALVAMLTAALVVTGWWVREQLRVDTPAVHATPSVQAVLATGRPEELTLAQVDDLKIKLPIARNRITAIGYFTIRDGDVLTLDPEGAPATRSLRNRLFRRFLATEQAPRFQYYMLQEGAEPNAVQLGAVPGTEVYAPVSGTVVAIAGNVIDGIKHGVVLQVQPLGDAETVVLMRNLDIDDAVAVGQTVTEGVTRLGTVRETSDVQDQPLARYTTDSGDHLELWSKRVQPDTVGL